MLKSTLLGISSIVAALFCWVASASAQQVTNVAGWDFSQYAADGALSIDGSTYTNTLDANYSDEDPSGNAGAGAAAFGTLLMDGTAGSTNVNAGAGSEQVLPTAANMLENLDRNAPNPGTNGFNSFSILQGEGQTFSQRMALTARAAADVVFMADVSSLGGGAVADGWSLALAGKSLESGGCAPSCGSSVTVEFSSDGSSYTSKGTIDLTEEEQSFHLPLQLAYSDKAYVKLGLDASKGQPVIDNVAINAVAVPEPGMALQFGASLATIAAVARRRRRR